MKQITIKNHAPCTAPKEVLTEVKNKLAILYDLFSLHESQKDTESLNDVISRTSQGCGIIIDECIDALKVLKKRKGMRSVSNREG